MIINIEELKDIKDKEILTYIKTKIMEEEISFITNFYECSVLFNWEYFDGKIDKAKIIDSLIDFSFKIIKSIILNFKKKGKWKKTKNVISNCSGGRISVSLIEINVNSNNVFVDIEFTTTL